jgi:hypothetical protein
VVGLSDGDESWMGWVVIGEKELICMKRFIVIQLVLFDIKG